MPPDVGIIGIDLGSIHLAASVKAAGSGSLSTLRAVPGLGRGSNQLAFVHNSGKWYCGEEEVPASSFGEERMMQVQFAKPLLEARTAG